MWHYDSGGSGELPDKENKYMYWMVHAMGLDTDATNKRLGVQGATVTRQDDAYTCGWRVMAAMVPVVRGVSHCLTYYFFDTGTISVII